MSAKLPVRCENIIIPFSDIKSLKKTTFFCQENIGGYIPPNGGIKIKKGGIHGI